MPPTNEKNKMARLRKQTPDDKCPYYSKGKVMDALQCETYTAIKRVYGYETGDNYYFRKGGNLHEAFESYYLHVLEHGLETTGSIAEAILDCIPYPEGAGWSKYAGRHIPHFITFELERLDAAVKSGDITKYPPAHVEAEWWSDSPPYGTAPWMGFVDAVYHASSFPWIDSDNGLVVVDFKTGKSKAGDKDEWLDKGIYTELEYYRWLGELQGLDITASAVYYPQEHDVLVVPDAGSGRRRSRIRGALDTIDRLYADPESAKVETQALCHYGHGKCAYWTGNPDANPCEGQCPSQFGLPGSRTVHQEAIEEASYNVPETADGRTEY